MEPLFGISGGSVNICHQFINIKEKHVSKIIHAQHTSRHLMYGDTNKNVYLPPCKILGDTNKNVSRFYTIQR